MNDQAPCVLNIAYDESLLRTREWILKAAGFKVTSALGFTNATSHCGNANFDLVILGHSIPHADKVALINKVNGHNHSRILSLRRFGEESLHGVKECLESELSGPDDFLAAVRTILDRKQA
jgi:DNA-binding response OmpR family regulator